MANTRPQDTITVAFATVCTPEGRFGIGVAERGKPGYWPMAGYGSFGTYEEASTCAARLNGSMGIEPETAASIVCSSMRK